MVRRGIIVIVLAVACIGLGLWIFSSTGDDPLPSGFRREVRNLGSNRIQVGTKRTLTELLHRFGVRRPRRGTTPLDLDGATMCWGYSNPTSAWFAFGDMVGRSNLCYWELALANARTVTGALTELSSTRFYGLDSNYWAGQLGSNNVAFDGRAVGHGAIRIETNRVLFARHVGQSNVVRVVRLKSFEEGKWGDVRAEFNIGSVSLDRQSTP